MTLNRTVALVGMMGAGKTAIGKRLAARLEVPFADADHEIVASAANMTVAEIFEKYGEGEFRRLERSVIARLLGEPPAVLATGGGAYIDDTTRAALKASAFTIWLKAPVDVLLGRLRKSSTVRPLLATPDPRATLEKLLAAREPVYAKADLAVESDDDSHAVLVDKIVDALTAHGLCGDA
ncbi:MAG TPA: shikimate kinase [Rhizomicrobium sp.]|jgi:shikimate kinase|nr:shikimate kinase [Rhizomicrobium sp.]